MSLQKWQSWQCHFSVTSYRNKKNFVLTFSVAQIQRRGRSKFGFLWGAFLSWVPLASHVSGGWLTWVPLSPTIATSVTISHGVTVWNALNWLENTNVDIFQNRPQFSAVSWEIAADCNTGSNGERQGELTTIKDPEGSRTYHVHAAVSG